jgi:hypothetical protein
VANRLSFSTDDTILAAGTTWSIIVFARITSTIRRRTVWSHATCAGTNRLIGSSKMIAPQ